MQKTGTGASSQAGNLFVALFAATALIGVLGAGLSAFIKGPVRSMAEVTRHSTAQNAMIAAGRLGIAAAAGQDDGGDCDGDGFIEPVPFRSSGAGAPPAGGGFVPVTFGAALHDPWKTDYGYCVWDHGSVVKGADCGGTSAARLRGSGHKTDIAIAILSAGPNRVFETSCNDYLDANADNVADTLLVLKPAGSDDLVFMATYEEAAALGGGLWKLKDNTPGTAVLDKNIEITGDAAFSGILKLGGGLTLPSDPGDDSVTGACSAANNQVLRANISTQPPTLEICDHSGGGTDWQAMKGSGGGGGDLQGGTDTVAVAGASCPKRGELAKTAGGKLMVCEDDTPATLTNLPCAFPVGALTFNSKGSIHVCTQE